MDFLSYWDFISTLELVAVSAEDLAGLPSKYPMRMTLLTSNAILEILFGQAQSVIASTLSECAVITRN